MWIASALPTIHSKRGAAVHPASALAANGEQGAAGVEEDSDAARVLNVVSAVA